MVRMSASDVMVQIAQRVFKSTGDAKKQKPEDEQVRCMNDELLFLHRVSIT